MPTEGNVKKWVKRLVVIAVVLIVVVVIAVWLGIDRAARKGVEIGGTQALGVETKCAGVHVGLLSGSLGIKGFQIGNPEGYKTDRLMALGKGKVACDIGSLMGDEVVVHEILIDAPELTVELKAGVPPKSNLGDLLKKLESDKQKPKEEKPKDEGEPKRFKVELIRITGTKVRFHLLAGKTANLTLPDIELKDVKNADGTPLMLADVFGHVLVSMGTSAVNRAKVDGVVPAELLTGLGDTLASAQSLLGGGARQLKAGVGKVTGGLKGVLGKDKKDGDQAEEKKDEGGEPEKKGLGGKLKGVFGKKKD